MPLSQTGISLIQSFERLRLRVYLDTACLPTIGWGHLITPKQYARFGVDPLIVHDIRAYRQAVQEKNGPEGKVALECARLRIAGCPPVTAAEANALFDIDKRWVERALATLVKVPLIQCQYDALASFTYNLGQSSLAASMLLRKLNTGEYEAVPVQMRKFRFSAGQVNSGLENRRQLESAMWRGELEIGGKPPELPCSTTKPEHSPAPDALGAEPVLLHSRRPAGPKLLPSPHKASVVLQRRRHDLAASLVKFDSEAHSRSST